MQALSLTRKSLSRRCSLHHRREAKVTSVRKELTLHAREGVSTCIITPVLLSTRTHSPRESTFTSASQCLRGASLRTFPWNTNACHLQGRHLHRGGRECHPYEGDSRAMMSAKGACVNSDLLSKAS